MADTISCGVSATSRCWSASASTPPAAQRLVTTGTPMAMASRILFCVPRAMASGATISAELRMKGRTSGTLPVTVTPGSWPRAWMAGDGSAPTTSSFMPARRARSNGQTSLQKRCMHS